MQTGPRVCGQSEIGSRYTLVFDHAAGHDRTFWERASYLIFEPIAFVAFVIGISALFMAVVIFLFCQVSDEGVPDFLRARRLDLFLV